MTPVALLLALAQAATASSPALYDPVVFQSVQSSNATVVLQFLSPNCRVCDHQEEALERIAHDPVERAPVILQVAFARETALRASLKVSSLSTLLVMKGSVELGRDSGLETEDEIRAFIRTSLERYRGRPRPRAKRPFHPKR